MKEKIFIISLFYLLIFIQSNYVQNENDAIIMNIYYKNKVNYTIQNSSTIDLNVTAYAIYNKSYERIGWDFLAIASYKKNDSKFKDEDKAYAMGYLEGILTKDRIYSFFINAKHYSFHKNQFKIPDNVKEFLKKNIEYMKEMSSKKKTLIFIGKIFIIYISNFKVYMMDISLLLKRKKK